MPEATLRTFSTLLPLSPASPPLYKCPSSQHQKTKKRHQSRKDQREIKESPREMDFRVMGLDSPLFSTLHHLMDLSSHEDESAEKAAVNAPTRSYVRDARAMASTPADVKELPGSYVFVIDMPGVKSGEIKVQVEDDNLLVISGERKREEEEKEKELGKYLRMERRMGKFMRKFSLPENANTDAVSAVCQDGVLTVAVQKLPPPEPKKPKTIQVNVA